MEFKELFEPIINFIKGLQNKDKENSKDEAKKRLQLVLMQDRASVSPDFFEMMKKEIIEVIKKYIEIDEEALEVQLTRGFEDGVTGPALFANIPIKNIKPIAKKGEEPNKKEENEEDTENVSIESEKEKTEEGIAEKEEENVEKTEENESSVEEVKEESGAIEEEEQSEASVEEADSTQETKTCEDKKEEVKEDKKEDEKTKNIVVEKKPKQSNKSKKKSKSRK